MIHITFPDGSTASRVAWWTDATKYRDPFQRAHGLTYRPEYIGWVLRRLADMAEDISISGYPQDDIGLL